MKQGVYTAFHSIEELLKLGEEKGVLYVSGGGKRTASVSQLARRQGYQVKNVSRTELTSLCGNADHRGIAFVGSGSADTGTMGNAVKGRRVTLEQYCRDLESDNALVVILDGITDPHNLGAILRSSDQFGADMIIVPSRNSAGEK